MFLINIRRVEELSLNAWPALQTKLYDGWILRFSNGFTKRANSVNQIYSSTLPIEEKIDFCEKLYRRQELPVIFKLTEADKEDVLESELALRGYSRIAETSVMILNIDSYSGQADEGVVVKQDITDIWVKGFVLCARVPGKYHAVARKMLNKISSPVFCAELKVSRQFIGCGLGVLEQDFMGIFDVAVADKYRNNGYGRALMHSLVNKAAEFGVKQVYLQVAVGNNSAKNLYERLGFQEQYRYWYRVKSS